jgi:hypothetical protein
MALTPDTLGPLPGFGSFALMDAFASVWYRVFLRAIAFLPPGVEGPPLGDMPGLGELSDEISEIMDLALAPGVEASSMNEGGGRDWYCIPEACG